jgi:hypothetical protein
MQVIQFQNYPLHSGEIDLLKSIEQGVDGAFLAER